MFPSAYAQAATWIIAAVATGGVIFRPWGLPEAIWAVLGAVALVGLSLLPWTAAVAAAAKGLDVYLFLIGMMLIAELAREEGLFDWLAAYAVGHAGGSQKRLFCLVYAVGIVVTVFLSNDATAVVLTPAVFAAATAATAQPLPYLYICAFIANAASFVLPISNPANLVVYGSHLPTLGAWLSHFGWPSLAAIAATFAALWLTQRRHLDAPIAEHVPLPRLSMGGRLTAAGIAVTTVALLIASALDSQLGAPTLAAGVLTAAIICLWERKAPWPLLSGVSWSVLPLVAGLFVLVAGLEHTGVIAALTAALKTATHSSVSGTAWGGALLLAFGSNLVNNLPAGLIAASTIAAAGPPPVVTSALLIGVDLGPNLSVTGSLATILWLVALRREQVSVGALEFLRLGVVVMVPALVAAIAVLVLAS